MPAGETGSEQIAAGGRFPIRIILAKYRLLEIIHSIKLAYIKMEMGHAER
jgi:hypothetical protein